MQASGALTFYKIPNPQAASKVLAKRLMKELSMKRRVLWLVSGGGNVPITVEAMKLIPTELQSYLAIMPADERYGPCGHKDSNLQQLHEAGFKPGNTTVVPVLTPDNPSLEATTSRYEAAISTAFANADCIIVQLGMGSDGHIAGILPTSPAIVARTLVTGYRTKQYERITVTFKALKQVTTAYVFAFGTTKREQLEQLRDKKLPITKQPAQMLKSLRESYVYNDQLGGTV